jgi:hypothetical protein
MIPTVAVTVTAFDQNGNPVSGGRVQAELDRTEIYNGFIAPECIEGVTDADGVCVLQLWPNALGSKGSSYHVRAYNPDTGLKYLNTTAVVPNNACRLEQIIVAQPFPPIDASGQVLIAVQAVLGLTTSQRVLADESAAGATAAQQGAVAAAADALASQGIAQTSANTAATQAGVSTTQAEIATNAANTADAITADALTAAAAAAASVLALKQGAESASTASGLSATASNAAKEIATEEAGKAFVSAGESAASATDAEAASALITNKVEVNITTAGNILRADGTLFKSTPERDLGANLSLYQKTPLLFDKPSILEFYDNCERIGTTSDEPMGQADSGQTYVNLVGSSGKYNGLSRSLFSNAANGDIIGIENVNVLPSVFLTRSGFVRVASGTRSGIYFYVDANNWVFFGASGNTLLVITKASGVETIVRSIANAVLISRAQLKFHFFLSPQNGGYGLTVPEGNLTCFIGSESATLSLLNQATSIGFSGTIFNYSITVAKTF